MLISLAWATYGLLSVDMDLLKFEILSVDVGLLKSHLKIFQRPYPISE